MSTQHQEHDGPSGGNSRAHLGAVKTPRAARPRPRRAGGLDRACGALRQAFVDGPSGPRPGSFGMSASASKPRTHCMSSGSCVLVTIGRESRVYHAFVTPAPSQLDAPSTITLYTSTPPDVAGLASDELSLDRDPGRLSARLVLVETTELALQRARYREVGYVLAPADRHLVGLTMLEHRLWRRLRTSHDDAQGEK